MIAQFLLTVRTFPENKDELDTVYGSSVMSFIKDLQGKLEAEELIIPKGAQMRWLIRSDIAEPAPIVETQDVQN